MIFSYERQRFAERLYDTFARVTTRFFGVRMKTARKPNHLDPRVYLRDGRARER